MKPLPKTNPKCPECNTISKKTGLKKNKLRTVQRYLCKNKACKTSFTLQPNLQKHKTYKASTILSAVSNINLGYSLKQTKNYFKKQKIPRSTLSYWYNQLKPTLPYHRIRSKIKQNYNPTEIIKKTRFIHHKQPFTYQYHKPKLDLFLKGFPKLKHYLENVENIIQKNIFSNSQRISEISKKTNKIKNIKINTKQNYATKLAGIALQTSKDNKQRHDIIENLMLKNDTATIATEIPVYLKLKDKIITGHIDILQIRYHKIHILDFKPEKETKQQTTQQLKLYQQALSKRTNIPEQRIKLAFFNHKEYCEIR